MGTAFPELTRYWRLTRSERLPAAAPPGLPSVFVSLTTIEARIGKILPTIASLLDQDHTPSKIFLWLPLDRKTGRPFELPSFLQQADRLEMRWVQDLGPATKWYYLLDSPEIPDGVPLVVLDDDQIYPRKLLAYHLRWQNALRGSVITPLGWRVSPECSHRDRKVLYGSKSRLLSSQQLVVEPTACDCVQGASSFSFKKGLLHASDFDFDQELAAWFADDILICGECAKRNIPRWVAPASFKYCRLHAPAMRRGGSLSRGPNRDGKWVETLYRRYAKYWKFRYR